MGTEVVTIPVSHIFHNLYLFSIEKFTSTSLYIINNGKISE